MTTQTIKRLAAGTAVVAVFTFAGFALAQGPGAGIGQGQGKGQGRGQGAWCDQDGPGFGPGIERLAQRLDLSEEQVKAVTELQEKSRTANQGLRKDLLRLRNDLEGELLKDQPDAKAVKGLVAKIGDLRTQMQQNRMETRLAVRQLLTPEQRDQMLLMGERFGRGGRGGRGGEGRHEFGRERGPNRGPGRGQGRGFDGDCPRIDD